MEEGREGWRKRSSWGIPVNIDLKVRIYKYEYL